MEKLKFKNIEDYYEYHAQGNTFAPKFKDLADSSKAYWANRFEKHRKKGDL